MPKRTRDDDIKSEYKRKKKLDSQNVDESGPPKPIALKSTFKLPTTSTSSNTEIDFPRGGGSSFTPLETKVIRAEAIKELRDEEIFKDSAAGNQKLSGAQKLRKQAAAKALSDAKKAEADKDRLRIEHLNYKRLVPGQRLLCQITAIYPLALVLSLPNQLLGHVPITHISSLFTQRLESLDNSQDDSHGDDEDEVMKNGDPTSIPELQDLFKVGQYVVGIVEEVRVAGARGAVDFSRNRDETTKASRRVELSLAPEKVNGGLIKADIQSGMNLPAVVKSVEDHGYILDLGLAETSGFISLKESHKGPCGEAQPLAVGQVITTTVLKTSANGRTVTLSMDESAICKAMVSEVSSIASVLPGALVQCLITAVLGWGLNVQFLGFFGGTLDLFHIPTHLKGESLESRYKVGQKIRARILWDVSSTSPKTFALSALEHVLLLDDARVPSAPAGSSKAKGGEKKNVEVRQPVKEAYPVGTVIDDVEVLRVESEWGLVCSLSGGHGPQGFVHISQVSDEHVPSLSESSGLWKIGTAHRARAIGVSPLDGLVQLSLKPSVIDQKYLRAADLAVGDIVKGTVKTLSEVGLFVSLSDSVEGVVWPKHFSDIRLKNPERKFKAGNIVKCRVLGVDEAANRLTLTLKKSLIDTDLPIVTKLQDAKVGLVTPGVVSKLFPKSIVVQYFGDTQAAVPLAEASDEKMQAPESAFTIGQVVRTRILNIDKETQRIVASIKRAAPNYVPPTNVDDISLGAKFNEALVVEVQKDNVAVDLQPVKARALLSIANLARARGVTTAQLRADLVAGSIISDILIVVSKNVDKNFVIASASPPKDRKNNTASSGDALNFKNIRIGDQISGTVTSHSIKYGLGCEVQISSSIYGTLHPTDFLDDFSSSPYPPPLGASIRTSVVDIDAPRRRLLLSARPSRISQKASTSSHKISDLEIISLASLKTGQHVRGFVKSVADAGLFVSIGRGLDGRVQIKELFDEYVKDWKPRFSLNQVVEARVLKVNTEARQIELTLRTRDLTRPAETITFEDLLEGANVDGTIKKVELYGLFIEIKGSKISGLCHKTELSDSKKGDVAQALRLFREGDTVRAHILSIDVEKRKVNFSLKPSHFADDPQINAQAVDQGSEAAETAVVSDDDVESQVEEGEEDSDRNADENGGEDEDEDEDLEGGVTNIAARLGDYVDEDGDVHMGRPPLARLSSANTSILQLSRGFQWGATSDVEEHPDILSSDEENAREETSKARKKKKRPEIQQDLTAMMHTKAPESIADFERLLLSSPNSSFLWIQYMSFQLQLSEIEKAREIGRRAISAINFREEQEKLNVWIARLNLENSFGTEEAFEASFRDAARHHDAKHMHLRVASILEQAEKYEKADEFFRRATKKFGQSSKVWTLYGELYFNRKMLEEARKLLPRSLQSLERRKHLKTISKFAQLEYKLGDPERGKTIFEGIIDSHPKRLDLWSVYIDMETGQKDIQSLRSIFERLFHHKLSSKKAKFFFKKWLSLERTLGDEEGAENVKSRALAWTQAAERVQS